MQLVAIFTYVVLVAALVFFSLGWLLLVGSLSMFLFTVGCRLLPASLLLAVICSVCHDCFVTACFLLFLYRRLKCLLVFLFCVFWFVCHWLLVWLWFGVFVTSKLLLSLSSLSWLFVTSCL